MITLPYEARCDAAQRSTAQHNTPHSSIAYLINLVVAHYTRSWSKWQWVGFTVGCLIAGAILITKG
jgi:hypothetical protein